MHFNIILVCTRFFIHKSLLLYVLLAAILRQQRYQHLYTEEMFCETRLFITGFCEENYLIWNKKLYAACELALFLIFILNSTKPIWELSHYIYVRHGKMKWNKKTTTFNNHVEKYSASWLVVITLKGMTCLCRGQ